jgi:hypothetical protein
MVYNRHERVIPATPEQVWALLAEIGSDRDVLWPKQYGLFRFPEGLHPGAPVHHGLMRYRVGAVEPGRRLWFDTHRAISGGHGFELVPVQGGTLVSHELKGRTAGTFRFLWPLVIRRKHNAVLELILDALEREAAHADAG